MISNSVIFLLQPPVILLYLYACVVREKYNSMCRYYFEVYVYILVDFVKGSVLPLTGEIWRYRNDSYYY